MINQMFKARMRDKTDHDIRAERFTHKAYSDKSLPSGCSGGTDEVCVTSGVYTNHRTGVDDKLACQKLVPFLSTCQKKNRWCVSDKCC